MRSLKETYTKEVRKEMSRFQKSKPFSKETKRKILAKTQVSPNKFEQKCLEYLEKEYPSKFKYVGDGSFLVESYSPDAYSEELKTVVLFQGDFYHCNLETYPISYYSRWWDVSKVKEKDNRAIKAFKEAGYKVLVIWENDINKLLGGNKKCPVLL
jgi:G:T-mismatch repair DNA endonuclease (very short patch repair protein)